MSPDPNSSPIKAGKDSFHHRRKMDERLIWCVVILNIAATFTEHPAFSWAALIVAIYGIAVFVWHYAALYLRSRS